MSESLGLVEVVGFSTAVYVADSMVKTAEVQIEKVERARGAGWMTVYVTGDVGAVNASVAAGQEAAEKKGNFVSAKVIARPATDLAKFSKDEQKAVVDAPETKNVTAEKTEKTSTTKRTTSSRNTKNTKKN